MKDFSEVANEYDPSSFNKEIKEEKEYELPEDEEAEKLIKIEGLTTDELIDMCFQGIDLVTYTGDYFTRTFLARSINSAIDTAEQTFDIALTPRTIEKELHDYEGPGINEYSYTTLFVRPAKKINEVKYYLGNNPIMSIPLDWIQLDKNAGALTIFPVSGGIQPLMPMVGSVMPFFGSRSYMPMGLSVSYEAGMEKEEIPENLLEFIYKKASISIFEVWGDQIIGAGIASSSLSIDGLSQSVGTTQSAMYGGASARILEYRKDLEELTPIIRRHFARINSVVL